MKNRISNNSLNSNMCLRFYFFVFISILCLIRQKIVFIPIHNFDSSPCCIKKAKEQPPTINVPMLFLLWTSTPWCPINVFRHFVPSALLGAITCCHGNPEGPVLWLPKDTWLEGFNSSFPKWDYCLPLWTSFSKGEEHSPAEHVMVERTFGRVTAGDCSSSSQSRAASFLLLVQRQNLPLLTVHNTCTWGSR